MELIDRDDLEYDAEWSDTLQEFTGYSSYQINTVKPIIKDGMTNGEVIQALFPTWRIQETNYENIVASSTDTYNKLFSTKWWNSPYGR